MPDEQPRQHDDDQRAGAGVVDLLDDEAGLAERGDRRAPAPARGTTSWRRCGAALRPAAESAIRAHDVHLQQLV